MNAQLKYMQKETGFKQWKLQEIYGFTPGWLQTCEESLLEREWEIITSK